MIDLTSQIQIPMLTCDLHIDLPWIMTKYRAFQLKDGFEHSQLSLTKLRAGGLKTFVAALYLPDEMQLKLSPRKVKDILTWQIDRMREQEGCQVIYHSNEVEHAYSLGKYPIMLALEGGRLLQNSLLRLVELSAWGIRYLTLTHNRNTDWADSATDKENVKGLTDFGVEVVKKCNALGVVVDISHASDKTAFAAINASSRPVMATHSGARKVLPHCRNLSDELIKAVAETGGVIGVPFAKRFIGESWKSISDHIEHIVTKTGIEHVAIGSDLDGAVICTGVPDVSNWRWVVCNELTRRGFKQADVELVAGGNAMRMLK